MECTAKVFLKEFYDIGVNSFSVPAFQPFFIIHPSSISCVSKVKTTLLGCFAVRFLYFLFSFPFKTGGICFCSVFLCLPEYCITRSGSSVVTFLNIMI